MKQFIIILSIILLSISNCFSQNTSDTICYVKKYGSYMYFKGYKELNVFQLNKTLKINTEAHKEMKKSLFYYISSTAIGSYGGALLGFSIAYWIVGGTGMPWIIPATGIGLISFSVPLIILYNKKTINAISIYNSQIKGF